MGKKKDRIPKMSPQELRKLRGKLEKTRRFLWGERTKTSRHLNDIDHSLDRTSRIENRIRYWLGKSRALQCPAFKDYGRAQGQCMVHNPDWSSTYQHLFRWRCSECKLDKKTRMKTGVFNGVFGQKQVSSNIP